MFDCKELISKALGSATDTKDFVVGSGAICEAPALFMRNFLGMKALVVADDNTFRACGARVLASFAENGIGCLPPLIFEGKEAITASFENLVRVRDYCASFGEGAVLVAVGSGTINDLCKRASHELGRAYFSVATAASVDGYASFGAPITKDGFKKTWPCAAPKVVLADVDVLVKAPKFLSSSGYADLLAKVPSGGDWILASAVGQDPVINDIWATTQLPLRELVDSPGGIEEGDPDCLYKLFVGLAVTGFAMQATHSSRPASGAEHLYSHYWEMCGVTKADGTHPTHGDKVAIGSLLTTRLMELFFADSFTLDDVEAAVAAYPTWDERERAIRSILPYGAVADEAVEASRGKYLGENELRERLTFIAKNFDCLREKVLKQIIPHDELALMLKRAGAPSRPFEIGLSPKEIADGTKGAQMIRNRYTILDLVFEAGRLEKYIPNLMEM